MIKLSTTGVLLTDFNAHISPSSTQLTLTKRATGGRPRQKVKGNQDACSWTWALHLCSGLAYNFLERVSVNFMGICLPITLKAYNYCKPGNISVWFIIANLAVEVSHYFNQHAIQHTISLKAIIRYLLLSLN